MLQLRTLDALEELKSKVWFDAVGEPLLEKSIRQVHSWQEAEVLGNGAEWENAELEMQGMMSVQLSVSAPTRDWNQSVQEIRSVLIPVVIEKMSRFRSHFREYDKMVGTVRYDLMLIALNIEFSDVIDTVPQLTAMQAYYLNGHFPCGWVDGIVPSGRLVVY